MVGQTCGNMVYQYWLNFLCFASPGDSPPIDHRPKASNATYIFGAICTIEQISIIFMLLLAHKKKKQVEESRKLRSIRNFRKNYAVLILGFVQSFLVLQLLFLVWEDILFFSGPNYFSLFRSNQNQIGCDEVLRTSAWHVYARYAILVVESIIIHCIIIIKLMEWLKAIDVIKTERVQSREDLVKEQKENVVDESEYCNKICRSSAIFAMVMVYEVLAYFVLPVYLSSARAYLAFNIAVKAGLALVLSITFYRLRKLMLQYRKSEFTLIEKELYW